ncbi:NAD(P)/FAD-dependent oxidoreductase [Chloroflexota bacterium]
MFDWDVVIIGGGPAGLTAGLYLSRGRYRTVLLEKENFGGPMLDYELIENYPGFTDGVAGAQLASEMVSQATKYGLQLEMAEVTGIELFKSCRWVKCSDEAKYTTAVVIIAGGSRPKKLGVPGEEELQGKGVFECAFCDGGQFVDRVVAVCGGGDAGITEALYMTKLASKVILFEALPELTATAILQERALANPKLEVRCGVKVEAIIGDAQVKAIEFQEVESGQKGTLNVDGVLVHVGLDPNTSYLSGLVPLDSQGQIVVNERMETEVPYILAVGDIRSGSPRQIVTAVGDGATAAITAQRLLQELT